MKNLMNQINALFLAIAFVAAGSFLGSVNASADMHESMHKDKASKSSEKKMSSEKKRN